MVPPMMRAMTTTDAMTMPHTPLSNPALFGRAADGAESTGGTCTGIVPKS